MPWSPRSGASCAAPPPCGPSSASRPRRSTSPWPTTRSSRGYQAAALAPVGSFDKQPLLASPSVTGRLHEACRLLGDQVELLQARLAGG